MNIVITGGSGYLGLRLAEFLLTNSFKVILLVSSRSFSNFTNEIDHKNLIVRKIDWDSKKSINESVDGGDIILHLAGMNANDCLNNPIEAYKFNALKTRELLESAEKLSIKKFIFFSTIHVYKKSLTGFIDENTPALNNHPYGRSNKAGEDFVLDYHSAKKIDCLILRISNAFGAPLNKKQNCWSLLINNISRQIFEDGKIIIHSEPNQHRNFISIKSINKIILNFIKINKNINDDIIYNIGSDNNLTISQIAENIKNKYNIIYGKNIYIDYTYQGKTSTYDNLEYCIEKIKKTSFYSDYFDEEINNLLKFCKNSF